MALQAAKAAPPADELGAERETLAPAASAATPPSQETRRANVESEAGTARALSDRALAGAARPAEAQTLEAQKGRMVRSGPVLGNELAQPRSGLHYARKHPLVALQKSAASRWRVGPHGLIEEQTPDGNWQTRPSGVHEDLLDVAFPTPQAGWIVGRAGTVLRSTDGGSTWQRVAGPTSRDLVSVTAQSALSTQVTARDGSRYSTTDGGKSWKPSPLP